MKQYKSNTFVKSYNGITPKLYQIDGSKNLCEYKHSSTHRQTHTHTDTHTSTGLNTYGVHAHWSAPVSQRRLRKKGIHNANRNARKITALINENAHDKSPVMCLGESACGSSPKVWKEMPKIAPQTICMAEVNASSDLRPFWVRVPMAAHLTCHVERSVKNAAQTICMAEVNASSDLRSPW